MSDYFPDHGLPLVQLKERRRDLVIALRNRKNPPAQHELMEIASVQQAIFAIEEVIANWDARGRDRFTLYQREYSAQCFPAHEIMANIPRNPASLVQTSTEF